MSSSDQDWEYDENEHWLIEDCITENGCGGSRNASVGTHDANRYVVMKSATCTENGKGIYYCSVCGCKSREVTIQATGHTWDSGEGTCVKTYRCTKCGETKTEGSHTPSSTVYYDQCISRSQDDKDTYHWALRRCTVCGCDLTQDGAEIDNYNSIWSTHREYHTGGYVTNITPTGDQMNNTAKTHVVTYSSCSKCNKSSYKQTVACEGVYVTCEIVNGKHLANYKCALCDSWWTEGCPGGDECKLIKDCNHTYENGDTAYERSEEYAEDISNASCGDAISGYSVCTICGDEKYETITIEHDGTYNGTTTVYGDCQNFGREIKSYTCRRCNKQYTTTTQLPKDPGRHYVTETWTYYVYIGYSEHYGKYFKTVKCTNPNCNFGYSDGVNEGTYWLALEPHTSDDVPGQGTYWDPKCNVCGTSVTNSGNDWIHAGSSGFTREYEGFETKPNRYEYSE